MGQGMTINRKGQYDFAEAEAKSKKSPCFYGYAENCGSKICYYRGRKHLCRSLKNPLLKTNPRFRMAYDMY